MIEKHEQSVPLLVDDEEAPQSQRSSKRQQWRIVTIAPWCYSFLVTCVLVYLSLKTYHSKLPYSPAKSAIRFQIEDVKLGEHTVFSSEPSHEMQTAWRDLLATSYVYVTEEEILRSGDDPHTSIKLAEGNYLAVLGVYHQLHCLRWLYYLSYEELYWLNMTDHQRNFRRGHGRHCIQLLLDYIKCKPDTALYTVGFDASTDKLPKLKSGASWQCVNWDLVENWAKSRSMGYDPTLLVPDTFFDDEKMAA